MPGGTYFFTLVTYRRQPIFADEQRGMLLRQAFREVKHKRPFDLLAAVVLRDHLHCLWRLPVGDADFSTRWQMLKTAFSRRMPTTNVPMNAFYGSSDVLKIIRNSQEIFFAHTA